ncbi:nuclease-related domain-containing protein [Lactobacillaceae bacterium Scapto_B20]
MSKEEKNQDNIKRLIIEEQRKREAQGEEEYEDDIDEFTDELLKENSSYDYDEPLQSETQGEEEYEDDIDEFTDELLKENSSYDYDEPLQSETQGEEEYEDDIDEFTDELLKENSSYDYDEPLQSETQEEEEYEDDIDEFTDELLKENSSYDYDEPLQSETQGEEEYEDDIDEFTDELLKENSSYDYDEPLQSETQEEEEYEDDIDEFTDKLLKENSSYDDEQLQSEKNAEYNKRRYIKHKQIDFKNKIIQSNVKNTDYINKFVNIGNMNKTMIVSGKYFKKIDELIKEYDERKFKLPFDLDDYIKCKKDFNEASSNYSLQKRGYEGEKRAYDDILDAINNTDHSYFYYHILTDVNVPFTYTSVINDEDTNNKDEIKNEGSTQIDILVISNYGIYALEVKNYDADHISIEGVKTKNNKQRFERINDELVPLAYIKRLFDKPNKDDKLMNDNNMISHQTFIHEKAMVNFVKDNLNMSDSDATNIVYSTLVYAKDKVDKDGNEFFSGNNVETTFKTKIGRYWKPFRTTAISSKGCFPWIMNYKNIDGPHKPNSLSNKDIDKLYEILKPYSGTDNEIAHKMHVFNGSPDECEKFIKKLYHLIKQMEKRVSN